MEKIYLDNGSTSFPKAPGVGKAMFNYIENIGVNTGRGSYQSSYALAEEILEAREKIRDFFGFNLESNVIFAPNVTFGLNYVIHGLLRPGDRLVISAMEHNAVARPAEKVREQGVDLAIAACDEKGRLNIDDLKEKLTADTKAVVMLHGSNVSGTLMPIKEVGRICREKGVFFIVDAAQTAGLFPIDMMDMNIDGLAFTGHKGLLGPQGIGGLLLSEQLAASIRPIIEGGTGSRSDSLIMPEYMPDMLEPGTMNIPGVIGLSAALDYIKELGLDFIRSRELELAGLFMEKLKGLEGIRLVGPGADEARCPIVSLDFTEKDNAEISFQLDSEYGIMTRCGMHCAPMAHRTLGTFPQGTVRFAFGHKNTEKEIEIAVKAIKELII